MAGTFVGAICKSVAGEGVYGESQTATGIHGQANADNRAGVWGENKAGGSPSPEEPKKER